MKKNIKKNIKKTIEETKKEDVRLGIAITCDVYEYREGDIGYKEFAEIKIFKDGVEKELYYIKLNAQLAEDSSYNVQYTMVSGCGLSLKKGLTSADNMPRAITECDKYLTSMLVCMGELDGFNNMVINKHVVHDVVMMNIVWNK